MPPSTTPLGQVMDKRRLTNKANEYYRQALQLADVRSYASA